MKRWLCLMISLCILVSSMAVVVCAEEEKDEDQILHTVINKDLPNEVDVRIYLRESNAFLGKNYWAELVLMDANALLYYETQSVWKLFGAGTLHDIADEDENLEQLMPYIITVAQNAIFEKALDELLPKHNGALCFESKWKQTVSEWMDGALANIGKEMYLEAIGVFLSSDEVASTLYSESLDLKSTLESILGDEVVQETLNNMPLLKKMVYLLVEAYNSLFSMSQGALVTIGAGVDVNANKSAFLKDKETLINHMRTMLESHGEVLASR